MSHLACPLCGKYAALSTLDPDDYELDIKVASFRGLGRGRGFAKPEVHSILGDDEYTPIIASRIEKLYYMLVNGGFLNRAVDDSTLNLMNENNGLKKQLASKDSRIYSLGKENMEKDSEIEELELRMHVDYIIFESLSLDRLAKLKFDEDGYYMVITPKTLALNLYLFFLMREVPDRLKREILRRVDGVDYPMFLQVLKRVEYKGTVADELMGGASVEYNPSGVKPYTLRLDELKNIVNSVKEKLSNPEEVTREHLKVMADYEKRLKDSFI